MREAQIGDRHALRGLHQFFGEHRIRQSAGDFVRRHQRSRRANMIRVVADPFAGTVRVTDHALQLVDRGRDERARPGGVEVGRVQTRLDGVCGVRDRTRRAPRLRLATSCPAAAGSRSSSERAAASRNSESQSARPATDGSSAYVRARRSAPGRAFPAPRPDRSRPKWRSRKHQRHRVRRTPARAVEHRRCDRRQLRGPRIVQVGNYNEGWPDTMTHTITLIPGDGIGPEVTEAVVRILKASGVSIEWERHLAGLLAFERTGQALPVELVDSIRPQQGRAQGAGDDADRRGVHERERRPAQGARSVREPAAGVEPARRRREVSGRRPGHRAREHRGSLRRPRARGRAGRRREPEDHHRARVDAHRALRVQARAAARPQEGHVDPQGEHHEAQRRAVPRVRPPRGARVHRHHCTTSASSTPPACTW